MNYRVTILGCEGEIMNDGENRKVSIYEEAFESYEDAYTHLVGFHEDKDEKISLYKYSGADYLTSLIVVRGQASADWYPIFKQISSK